MKLNEIPDSIKITLDKRKEIQEIIDEFFLETKNYLEKIYKKSPDFKIESKQFDKSDDRLTYLIYKDSCVAGVFERRTERNFLEYTFFRNIKI